MRVALLLFAGLAIAGCVTTTEPVQLTRDTYMITTHARGGFNSDGELITQTITTASHFCATKGLNFMMQSQEHKGVQGWTPQDNQVVFLCLAADDPRYQSGNYEPRADVVIEKRNR